MSRNRTLPILFVLIMILLSACLGAPEEIKIPGLDVEAGSIPSAQPVAQAFLDAWKTADYETMYQQLTSVSQSAVDFESFKEHFQGISAEIGLTDLNTEILSVFSAQDNAQVRYRVMFSSNLVGDFNRETEMNLSLEDGQWRVQWDDALVMPELGGMNYLSMDQQGYLPSRANIYDQFGHALVAQTDAMAVGLIPDQMDPAQQETMFAELETLTGMNRETIEQKISSYPSGIGWYLPLAEVPAEQVTGRLDILSSLSGLVLNSYRARYYFDNGVAPQVLGYMGAIGEVDLQDYISRGYRPDERVGLAGLEKWGESYLAGKRGGALYVLNGQGQPVTRLAESSAEPGQSIYTTLDRDFQLAAQEAISGFRGAVVVLERDTGKVLAMVSSPGFNPNTFEPVNYNSESLQSTLDSTDQPLLNRATQGLYPLGSVFKTITMAAALESGKYGPDSTLQCGYRFEELGSESPLYDWTWDYYQQDGVTKPSGLLTLSQGLMRSCNPWFYHIGLDLFQNGDGKRISDLARGFGLGSMTGIQGVDEAEGNVPDPVTDYDATNLGIGQGDLLVTPLQVARFMAAIGNGGTLYQPQLIDRILPPDGKATYVFEPNATGKIPLSSETLKALQEAMVGVIRSTKPVGTAWHQFTGLDIQVAGKTGTATSGYGQPHAWFAGYTFEGREDKPDIAVAVVLDNAGEGSAYAAPIFRRIVELYFSGQPQKLYWWESTYGVTRTPVP